MNDTKTLWVGWFVGFLLLGVGWALVTPVNDYPDEVDHVYRAVSVVRGEIFPHNGSYNHGTGAITNVPVTIRRVVDDRPCLGLFESGNCESAGPAHQGSVTVVTGEGRYFPLYYALVGWPSLAFPNQTGWYLMRLVSAVICAALFAAGASVLMSMRRRPLVLAAGLFVGLTPLALNLSGALNPSGLEIAAAVCFWAVVLALVHRTSSVAQRRLVQLGILSGVVLATCRQLGGLWIVLAVVVSLMSASRSERSQFLHSSSARMVLASAAIATAVMATWTVTFRSYETFYEPTPSNLGLIHTVDASLGKTGTLLRQMLAYLGKLNIPPTFVAEVCWSLAVLALVVIAVASSRRTGLVVLCGCVLVVALPFVALIATYHNRALTAWQGRYTLPLAIGIALVCVASPRPRTTEHKLVVPIAAVAVLLALVGQIAVFDGAWKAFGNQPPWYVSAGRVSVAVGAIIIVATIAWAEVRWRRAGREPSRASARTPLMRRRHRGRDLVNG
ncbi:MAG: DUF2142 domain-containing protein [Acidimicrobiia bacterium]